MFRPPAISHGVTSFVWAVVFGAYIWIAGAAVGFSGATTFVIGLVVAAGVFLYVRVYGEDDPNRP
jgi:hypothetical protein